MIPQLKQVNIVKIGEYYAVRIRRFWFFDSYLSLQRSSCTWSKNSYFFKDFCLTKSLAEAQKVRDYYLALATEEEVDD